MIEAGVPVVPGTQENLSGADEAVEACRRIGFPVMLKASQGGGGKGMRLARSEDEVREAFVAARLRGGGLVRRRNDLHRTLRRRASPYRVPDSGRYARKRDPPVRPGVLGTAQTSENRRGEPVPVPDAGTAREDGRRRRGRGRAVGYVGVGTIEFLVDKHRNYYFLEMNTRLQVEHPITEEVTGRRSGPRADTHRSGRAAVARATRHRAAGPCDRMPGLLPRMRPPGSCRRRVGKTTIGTRRSGRTHRRIRLRRIRYPYPLRPDDLQTDRARRHP